MTHRATGALFCWDQHRRAASEECTQTLDLKGIKSSHCDRRGSRNTVIHKFDNWYCHSKLATWRRYEYIAMQQINFSHGAHHEHRRRHPAVHPAHRRHGRALPDFGQVSSFPGLASCLRVQAAAR
ncbi:hypothetical protein Hsero_3228 [Herbaspirillum seropedicae SmR1]|uniref:Uncharacterized protein n=1 Tax=Herbaspirillum seropedicae (strain SmR1) TaxID=757424 RepID=D8J1E0_HERSS|nr:hypothetical protein Hsero_3228 [Herbaspirillum seropedicae SmR1]